jgi:hypothetical protein
MVERATIATNAICADLNSRVPFIFSILAMRNLSAFVGGIFANELERESQDLLRLNPHQDGYPDLLLMDGVGLNEWKRCFLQLQEKGPFSPFPPGGLEIKATCGDVPSASQLSKKGVRKPVIGDERIDLVSGVNWKSHHRNTNYLIGLLWDFFDGSPAVAAVMSSDSLTTDDWGKIVSPKEGGGNTTSVSIMNRAGVRKMAQNTVLVATDTRYQALVDKLKS